MCDCINCEYLFFLTSNQIGCGYDNRKEVVIDGDLALKHLYKECPLQKEKDMRIYERKSNNTL